jgi:hypothetical protein
MGKNPIKKIDEGDPLVVKGKDTRVEKVTPRLAEIHFEGVFVATLMRAHEGGEWFFIQQDTRKCFSVSEDCIRTVSTFMDIMDDAEQWLVSTQEEPCYAYIERKGKPGHIQIKADDDGFVVDIFDDEVANSVASAYAFYAELEHEEKD